MHINERIPVTITHVKENRKTVKKGKKRSFVVTIKLKQNARKQKTNYIFFSGLSFRPINCILYTYLQYSMHF